MSTPRRGPLRVRTDPPLVEDLQASRPAAPIGLTRAGVSRSAKAIRIRHEGGEQLFQAEVACFSDLGPHRKGVHMSRFEEVVDEAIDQAVAGEALVVEALAERIATTVVTRQEALRSEVLIRAPWPVARRTPVTGRLTQETYGLIGRAAASPAGSRRLVGVSAQGLNACPCAQGLLRGAAAEALAADGFGGDQIARILELVPVATHNQRARGTLWVGAPPGAGVAAETLVEIVEAGMSSEIYDLLERPDELYLVARAHRRPRFVEDSVREMARGTIERYPDLPDDAFLLAHQVNFETIHAHDVEAERGGTVGELRRELGLGEPPARHTTLAEWLGGGPAAA